MPTRSHREFSGRRRVVLEGASVLMLSLLVLSLPTVAIGQPVVASSGNSGVLGRFTDQHAVGRPDPYQLQLPPSYYFPVPVSNPYTGSVKAEFAMTSDLTVDLYVMNQAQFASFQSAGGTAAVFHMSGTSVASSVTLSPLANYYVVVWNDLGQSTANVLLSASTNPVDVYLNRSEPPVPVGIADYGVESNGVAPVAYEQTSAGVIGSATIRSLSAYNSTLPSNAKSGATLQLNVVLQVNTTKGQFEYWLQNVVTFSTGAGSLSYESEIFNFSAPTANLSSTQLTGNGRIRSSGYQNTYIFATQALPYSLPFGVQLPITVSRTSSAATIRFGYDVTANGASVSPSTNYYDTVTINEPGGITDAGIVVDGYKMAPIGLFYDSELVFCGVGSGWATTFTRMDAVLRMFYQSPSGTLVQPKSLFEFGGNTGESTYNLQTSYTNGDFILGLGNTAFTQNYLTPGTSVTPLTVSLAVKGGLPGSSNAPTFGYIYSGFAKSANLSSTPTVYYVDNGSSWTASTSVPGAQNERWALAGSSSGTAGPVQSLVLPYYHQYLISTYYTTVGSGSPNPPTLSYSSLGDSLSLALTRTGQNVWADAGSNYMATNPLGGSTSSERWYSQGNNGTFAVAGTLSFSYHHQYLLTIAGKTTSTAWFDEGTLVPAFNGPEIFSRANGVGSRVASHSLDGGTATIEPLTTGNITISVTMNAPHTLSLNIVNQYQVSLDAAAAKAVSSITAPTIQGDNYWYDSGTAVSLTANGAFGRSSGSGSRLASYSLNEGSTVAVSTTGAVNILTSESLSSPQSVSARLATQFLLSTPTGSMTSVTPSAISGDAGWYDSGTAVTVSYNYTWNVVGQQSRLAATGYSTDGGSTTAITRAASGTFSVPVSMNAAHSVDVKYVTQYYTSFQFSDAAGKRTIVPSALQISIGGHAQPIPGFAAWLDNGTSFTISSVTYEGVDVKPTGGQQYSVTAPLPVSVKTLVYDAQVKVSDFLGLPVSGADVKMTLANGSVLSGGTGGDGTFLAPAIPLGTFTATVSALGSSTQVSGDASKQNITQASVIFSTTSLALTIVVVVVIAILAILVLRRKSQGRRASQ